MNEEKLMINIPYLEQKAISFETTECIVEKAIPVSNYRFRQMLSSPMQDHKEILDNIEDMYNDGVYHCLLIYDKEKGDGLLVESEGYGYLRYAQFVPQAKLIWEQFEMTHAQKISTPEIVDENNYEIQTTDITDKCEELVMGDMT